MREQEEEGGKAQGRVVEISMEGCEEAFGRGGRGDGERKHSESKVRLGVVR